MLITFVSRCQEIGPRLIQCIALDIMMKNIQVLDLQGLPVLPMIIVPLLWIAMAEVMSFADARNTLRRCLQLEVVFTTDQVLCNVIMR